MKDDHLEYYGASSTPTDDFLAHYGVIGMKWGIRRAAKKGKNYEYKSHATKKYEKAAAKLSAKAANSTGEKAEKLKAKSSVMANRAKRSKEVDKGEEEYARSLSTGKALGLAALPGGANVLKAYAQHRAMSKQKGKDATGSKIASALEASYTGTYGSRQRKAGYIRQDEKKKGLNKWGHRQMSEGRKAFSDAIDPFANMYNKNKKKKRG